MREKVRSLFENQLSLQKRNDEKIKGCLNYSLEFSEKLNLNRFDLMPDL